LRILGIFEEKPVAAVLMFIQCQNVDQRYTNVGPMSKLTLGQCCIAMLSRQIEDVILTLSKPMIAIKGKLSSIDNVLFYLFSVIEIDFFFTFF